MPRSVEVGRERRNHMNESRNENQVGSMNTIGIMNTDDNVTVDNAIPLSLPLHNSSPFEKQKYLTPSPTKTVATTVSPASLRGDDDTEEFVGYDSLRKRLPFYTDDVDEKEQDQFKKVKLNLFNSRRKIVALCLSLALLATLVVASSKNWFLSNSNGSGTEGWIDVDTNMQCNSTNECKYGSVCALSKGTKSNKIKVCCSESIYINGEQYCSNLPVGSSCQSDLVCSSGSCIDLLCSSERLENNNKCDSAGDCKSGVCGLSSFSQKAHQICCSSEESLTFEGGLYCTSMDHGTTCGSDEMCSSNNCSLEYPSNTKQVCCKSMRTEVIGDDEFCTGKTLGESCAVNKMCLSSYCVNEKCSIDLLLPEMSCTDDFDCQNGVCAQKSVTEIETICCPSGEKISTNVDGQVLDVCSGQANGNICTNDELCLSSSCGMSNYTDDAVFICCTNGSTGPHAVPSSSKLRKEMFCSDLNIGETCASNEMCISNICLLGVCVSDLGDSGHTCDDNNDCANLSCAKETFRSKSKYVCCTSNEYVVGVIDGIEYNFCTGQPNGAFCASNEMCDSQICDGGICSSTNAMIGDLCSSDDECASGVCKEKCLPRDSCKILKSGGNPSEVDYLNIVFIGSGFSNSAFLEERVNRIFQSFEGFEVFGSSNNQYEAFYVDELHPSFCSYNCSTSYPSLICCDIPTAHAIAKNCFPPSSNQHTIVIENNSEYGGAAYYSSNIATTSINEKFGHLVAIHELGHSMFELGDEYNTSTSTSSTSPNCDTEGCPKFADLVERFDNVTCEVRGCKDGQYYVGGLTNMNWIEFPFGDVNLRYACCTFLLFTSQAPQFCERFEFSPGYLSEYCSNNYQGYFMYDSNMRRDLLNKQTPRSAHLLLQGSSDIITFDTRSANVIDHTQRSKSKGLKVPAYMVHGDYLEPHSGTAMYEVSLYFERGERRLFYETDVSVSGIPFRNDDEIKYLYQLTTTKQRRDHITVVIDSYNNQDLGKFVNATIKNVSTSNLD